MISTLSKATDTQTWCGLAVTAIMASSSRDRHDFSSMLSIHPHNVGNSLVIQGHIPPSYYSSENVPWKTGNGGSCDLCWQALPFLSNLDLFVAHSHSVDEAFSTLPSEKCVMNDLPCWYLEASLIRTFHISIRMSSSWGSDKWGCMWFVKL